MEHFKKTFLTKRMVQVFVLGVVFSFLHLNLASAEDAKEGNQTEIAAVQAPLWWSLPSAFPDLIARPSTSRESNGLDLVAPTVESNTIE